jgi:hypothetical protein
MELSENPEAYKFYYKHFLKCVIPSTTFKNCLRQDPQSLSSKVDRLARGKKEATNMVEFVTEAEETLGLFVLDNFSRVWQAQLRQEDTNKGEQVNMVFPKYTKTKKSALLLQKSMDVHVAEGKRLSDDGILRWNELSLKVAMDRARPERTAWEQEVLGEMAAEALSSKQKRRYEKVTQVLPSTVKLHLSIPDWMTTG